jgi:hypothetical protein
VPAPWGVFPRVALELLRSCEGTLHASAVEVRPHPNPNAQGALSSAPYSPQLGPVPAMACMVGHRS